MFRLNKVVFLLYRQILVPFAFSVIHITYVQKARTLGRIYDKDKEKHKIKWNSTKKSHSAKTKTKTTEHWAHEIQSKCITTENRSSPDSYSFYHSLRLVKQVVPFRQFQHVKCVYFRVACHGYCLSFTYFVCIVIVFVVKRESMCFTYIFMYSWQLFTNLIFMAP